MFSRAMLFLLAAFLLVCRPCMAEGREKRSATICQPSISQAFSSPRLQVFLTVNSLAKVYWDGTSDKRRLELNWVNPPDVRDGDYVGLFRRDPQWFGLFSNPPTVRVPAKQAGQYYLTNQEFPDNKHLHPYLVEAPLTTQCQHHFWIAYVRAGRVLAVNCLKTQPTWMYEMKEYLGSIPLHALMLPGSHNSGSYNKFETYADDTVLMRYSVNQERPDILPNIPSFSSP